jgi:SET domain-containing protein
MLARVRRSFRKTDNMLEMSKGNYSLAVKRTLTGLGLFALEPIPADKRIIEYLGSVISAEEADRRGGKYLFELDEKHAIDGSARSNTARYINHSCRPNAKGYTSGRRIWIWSLRAIKAGEEITIDYGKEYLDEHIKRCRCAKCEKRP